MTLGRSLLILYVILFGVILFSTGFCRVSPWANGYWHSLTIECHDTNGSLFGHRYALDGTMGWRSWDFMHRGK